MDKPKRQPDNAPPWLEPILWKTPVQYTFNVPIEVLADQVRGLEIEREHYFQPRTRKVEIEVIDIDTLRVEIANQRRNRGIDYSSALIRATLHAPDAITTVMTGYIRLGMVYLPLMILPSVAFVITFYVLFGMMGMQWFIFGWALFLMLLAGAFIWYWLVQDRSDLLYTLDELASKTASLKK